MEGIVLLNYDDDTFKAEEEERFRFLRAVLEQVGLPINEFWTTDSLLNIEQRARLRNILGTYNVVVMEDLDGEMQIYAENKVIAEWHKCAFTIKKDLRHINTKKQLYIEMKCKYWTIFDESDAEDD